MNDSDKILDALRRVYAQNQELQTKLDSLTAYLHDALGTATTGNVSDVYDKELFPNGYPKHEYNSKPKPGSKPWEKGFTKRDADNVQNTNIEGEPVSEEDLPESFKL